MIYVGLWYKETVRKNLCEVGANFKSQNNVRDSDPQKNSRLERPKLLHGCSGTSNNVGTLLQ